MKVVLMRHFKVNHQWKRYCSYTEFFEDMDVYNTQSVIQTRELDYQAKTVYISSLPRTKETAGYIRGNKTIIKTALIDEVNLKGQSRNKRRLSSIIWYVRSYLKWKSNSKTQIETHNETIKRASEFLKFIEDKKEDCVVVSHGMFLMLLIKIMRGKGYSGPKKRKAFSPGEAVEYMKSI
jgi:broad specificity phosphatase PhoE